MKALTEITLGRLLGQTIALLFAIPIIVIVLGVLIWVDGFVISDFWTWFAPVPWGSVTFKQAIGLSFLWNAFAYRVPQRPWGKEREDETWKRGLNHWLNHLLGMGLIYTGGVLFHVFFQ